MLLHKLKSLEYALEQESDHSIKSTIRIRVAIDVDGVAEDRTTILDIRSTEDLWNATSNLVKTKINRSHREGTLQQFLYSDDKGIGLDRVSLIRNTSQTSGKLPTVLRDWVAGTRNLVTQLKFFFQCIFQTNYNIMYTWDSYVHNITPLTITPRTSLDYAPSVFLFLILQLGTLKY